MSDNFGKRTRTISLLIAAIIATSIVSQNDFVGINAIENLYENNKDHILFDLLTIVGAIGFVVIPAIGVIPAIILVFFVMDRIMDRIRGNSLGVSLLDESKLYLDGYVSFKADLNVWLAHGFIKTSIEAPFGKTIDILSYNDGNKKKGNLKGKLNESIHWKWQIPSEFSDGKCKISISLYDGSIMRIFQKPELVLTKTYDVNIARWKSDPLYIC